MGIAIFITLALTTIFTARLESEQIRMVIGFAIILFCLTSYAFPITIFPKGGSFFSFFWKLSGVMGGLTSIGPPLVIYLIGKNADRGHSLQQQVPFQCRKYPLVDRFLG